MFHYHFCPIVISFLIFPISSTSRAEIAFDGSLGPTLELSGPNYRVEADQGTIMGGNLFHSFEAFNINSGESATFSGPDSVTNIIGRVTGGSLSHIDGTLTSTIPHANLYLLNPYGFMLGSNARINLNGSFYLSSANYLHFADGLRFDVNHLTPPLLTVAPVQAFGFLDNQAGKIIFNDFTNYGYATVNEGEELAVIGSHHIQIKNSRLSAPKGRIQIISAASNGEVMRSNVTQNTLTQLGEVTIDQGSFLQTNAQSGESGTIVIQSGQFFMKNDSKIQTLGETGTGDIEIRIAGQLQVTDNSQIRIVTTQGKSGKIVLRSEQIELSNGGKIISNVLGEGQGGEIVLEVDDLKIIDNAAIRTSTLGSGKGGTLRVVARGSIKMNNNGQIQAITFGKGKAGDIYLEINELILENGANVNASSKGIGRGGDITIKVTGTASISGQIVNPDGETNPSGIASSAFDAGDGGTVQISALSLNLDNWATIQTLTQGEGKAGDISIDVNQLSIMGGADIDASNEGTGIDKGGNITITATDSVFITATPGEDESNQFVVKTNFLGGIYSSANQEGAGGDIELSTRKLTMRYGGVISAGSEGLGDAGHLRFNIGRKLNLDNAAILTRAQQAGGGNIDINNLGSLYLNHSEITARAEGLAQYNKGGNVTITTQDFFTMNASRILASAIAGNGGNINITANHFLQSSDSVLDASSELGTDGDITINAPEDFIDSSIILPKTFFDASQFLLGNCPNYTNPNKGVLVLQKRSGLSEVFLQSGRGSKP